MGKSLDNGENQKSNNHTWKPVTNMGSRTDNLCQFAVIRKTTTSFCGNSCVSATSQRAKGTLFALSILLQQNI